MLACIFLLRAGCARLLQRQGLTHQADLGVGAAEPGDRAGGEGLEPLHTLTAGQQVPASQAACSAVAPSAHCITSLSFVPGRKHIQTDAPDTSSELSSAVAIEHK